MQLKHGKAVASRNIGSVAAWTLPQEVFTMETKRFLIPVVAALGLFFLGLSGLGLSSANATGLSPLSAGHDQSAMSGKSDVTQVRWYGGGWRGGGWRGVGLARRRLARRLGWLARRRLARRRLGLASRGLVWRRMGLASRLGRRRLGLARWRRPLRRRIRIRISRWGLRRLRLPSLGLWRLRLRLVT